MILTDSEVAYLQDILDHVTAHPDEWDQAVYGVREDCGTAACVAGHLVVRYGEDVRGFRPVWDYVGEDELAEEFRIAPDSNTVYLRAVDCPDGKQLEPGYAAARVLGQARHTPGAVLCEWLFAATNQLQNLWWYGQLVAEGRLAVPDGITPMSAGHEQGVYWVGALSGIDAWLPDWRASVQ